MPKIVFVHPAIRQYRQELFHLLDQNFDIKFLFTEDYEHNLNFLKSFSLHKWRAFRPQPFIFYSKGASWPLVKEALFGDYDIWISSVLNGFATHFIFPIVKLRGKRFALFSEDWWWQKSWKAFLIKPYAKFIARNCNVILVAGSRARNFFIELGADPSKIFLAFNATSGLFTPTPKVLMWGFTVLYLGRIVEYKGLDVLIKAGKILEFLIPNSKFLIHVVGDGDFKKDCEKLAQELDVKNIQFISAIKPEKIASYYERASCFVLPARFLWNSSVPAEAWGFTVNEALSAGLPVITTDAVASADDLIADGVNGFKIESDNPDMLAEKIKLLMENPETLLKMSNSAKDSMKSFTPQKQFEVFVKALTDDEEEIKNIKKITDEVHGWLSDDEAVSLYKLTKASSRKGVIVEIGSWQGKSTIWLAKSGNKVYAIDPHIGAPEQIEQYGHNIQTLEKFKSNINKAGISEMVAPIVETSEEAFKSWRGEPISFLFIDGSHQYEDVKKDFILWSPLVMDGGIIAFHDTPAPGPSQVLEEFIYSSKNFKVIKVIDSLTIVYKGKSLPLFTYYKQRLRGFKKFLWRKLKSLLQGQI